MSTMQTTPIDPRPLLPHTGAMVLIENIVNWDLEHITCTASSQHNADNPLRIAGILSIYTGIEYAVQAMAAHAQLKRNSRKETSAPRKGFLAAMSRITAHVPNLDSEAGTLHINAQEIASTPNSSMYKFTMRAGNRTLLEGQLTAVMDAQ